MADAKRDANRVTTLIGVSSVDGETPTLVGVNPATKALITETSISSADVTVVDFDLTGGQTSDVNISLDGESVAVTGTFWQTTQPISASALPLPTGAATSAKQLADNHNVTVSNHPSEFPLPAAQLTTLTPPAAITGFATEAKQLPDGHNVTIDNASIAVTGAFYQATQPVSLASVPSHAVTNAGTFATQATLQAGSAIVGKVGHDISGIGHGVTTVTTAGTDVVLAGSTACKKVDIQAQTDNTGLIAVGGSGVDATIATGTGIILYAGDVYSLEIDNLNDVYIDSTVNGEGVRYTYYT